MNKLCLNPAVLWKQELASASNWITHLLNFDYCGKKEIECRYSMADDYCYFTISITNKAHTNLEKRVLINLPPWNDYKSSSESKNLEMYFEFFDLNDNPYFQALAQPKSYKTELLFDFEVLKEIKKFLITKKQINLDVFKTFEV